MHRLALASILFVISTAGAADEPSFTFTLQKKEDAVEAASKDGTTTLTISSPGGIGTATITRKDKAWPKAVVVRLKLRGLEGFDASAGKTKMHAFVNTSSMKSVTFEKDGKKVEGYDAKHPLWTEIRIFGKDGKPSETIPFKDGGYFEIALPKEFLDGNSETLTLHWTDFYRR